jgi:ribosomal protein L23
MNVVFIYFIKTSVPVIPIYNIYTFFNNIFIIVVFIIIKFIIYQISSTNFEKIFNITVTSINTCILPTKTRRVGRFVGKRSVYKKAYVKLKEGDTISDLFN